jgi:uncharacterized delta-60 repeat protein
MTERPKPMRFGRRAGRLRPICIVLGFCLLECSLLYMVTGARNPAKKAKVAARSRIISQTAGTAGALDPTFGDGGKVTTDFSGDRDQAFDLAFQSDGKIVAVGASVVNPAQQSDFALARYNSNGSLDNSFGAGGKVITDFGGDDDALSVAIQSDGKIVAVGGTCSNSTLGCTFLFTGSGYDYAVARYNTNGSLDSGFGSGGKVTTDFNGGLDFASSVVIQPDGRILVGGTSCADSSMMCYLTGGTQFSLARYNTDGSLDSSFGNRGKVFTPVPAFGALKTIALQSDGKIVAVGLAHPLGDADFAVVRYNTDGTLDPSFGNEGIVTTDFNSTPGNPSSDTAYGVAIQPDGKIVTAGASEALNQNFFNVSIARYNSDGSLDGSFGAGGKVQTSLTGEDDEATSVAIQSDGKILVGGIAAGFLVVNSDELFIADNNTSAGSDFGLVRYNTDGSLDTSFGDHGMVTTDFFGFDDGARFALQPNGLVVGVGFARRQESSMPDIAGRPRRKGRPIAAWLASVIDTESDADFALARYETAVQPDFGLSAGQPTVMATAGSKVTISIEVSRIAGLMGKVTVTPPAAPAAGIKIPQTPESTKSDQVSFTIKIKASAAPGSYPLTFSGADKSGQSHSAILTLVVQ